MLNFLRKTSLYILAVPLLFTALGIASNQAVLQANHDSFPVLINERKLAKYLAEDNAEQKKDDPSTWLFRPIPVRTTDDAVFLDNVHVVMTKDTHLNALADVFDLGNIYSVGDFSLMLGDWLWAFAPFVFGFDAVRKLNQREY